MILVRWETTPDDIHGLIQASGILTAHGGMTSHAAVVARGMGKPCVAGCEGLTIDLEARTLNIGGHQLAEGDTLTIDGGSGEVIVGEVPLVPPQINEDFETILGWADELRRLKVRANADTPDDAAKAREFGAEGIGLCRTEHMFMAEDRLPVVREMIMASGEDERRSALERLLPHQQSDFEGIFEAMAGLPVTIRLLDPPLHEFLPPLEEAKDERMRERIKALHETNPMLGTRGCRLGLLWPEIYEMQVRAIVRAALAVEERTGAAPLVEIMHPLVGFAEELRRLRAMTVATANEESETLEYLVGTMIELPRACVRADEIADYADFFSFGTNDLTQTALGLSRDDAEGKFLDALPRGRRARAQPVRDARPERGRRPDADRRRARAGRQGEPQAGHLRRARRRAATRWRSATASGSTTSVCSPYRVPLARLAAAQAALSEAGIEAVVCRRVAASILLRRGSRKGRRDEAGHVVGRAGPGRRRARRLRWRRRRRREELGRERPEQAGPGRLHGLAALRAGEAALGLPEDRRRHATPSSARMARPKSSRATSRGASTMPTTSTRRSSRQRTSRSSSTSSRSTTPRSRGRARAEAARSRCARSAAPTTRSTSTSRTGRSEPRA